MFILGVYLLPGEKHAYSIPNAFTNALGFVADSHARTDRQGQVSVGVFTNVDKDLYKKSIFCCCKAEQKNPPDLPVFDEKKPLVIEDIIKLCNIQ